MSNCSSFKMISTWVMWKSDFHMAHVEIWFLFTSATNDFTNFLKMNGNFSMTIAYTNSYRNKYFRLKLTVRLFCLRSRLCNHKMWKCIWCQPDLSLITKEQTWFYIYTKNMIFALIFADSHTQTLFKKLGSLFDLPQIPDIVYHGRQ